MLDSFLYLSMFSLYLRYVRLYVCMSVHQLVCLAETFWCLACSSDRGSHGW